MNSANTMPSEAGAHILVVDDDAFFRESLSRNLSDAGYSASAFCDGQAAIKDLDHVSRADLILLDWKMPGLTGIELLQRLRAAQIETPVIFLTVLGDQIYEEAGLRSGALDFVEKSRSFSILLHRIQLSLAKSGAKNAALNQKEHGAVLERGPLVLRRDSRRAAWKGSPVELTLTEFNIVAYLVEHVDRDVSYREIYDIVHGEGFVAGYGEVGYRANVRAFIKRIRQKFREVDMEFSHITNYPSFGYRWRDEKR